MRLPFIAAFAVGAAVCAPVLAQSATEKGEAIFKNALLYTAQVRASVPLPFHGDRKGSGLGAGFLVDAERGWVMTNAHVVSRSAARVELAFHGQEFVEGRRVYVDPYLDVAIVEAPASIRPKSVSAPQLECQSLPPVGHPVGAFGHPWRLQFTGTRGIISGVTSRYQTELLQTDAPINQGNSGGPLISLDDGRIVGINTAGIRGAQNTNFAVAMKYACRILALLQAGRDPSPPALDVVFYRDVDDRKQLRVARTYASADVLQLAPGDLIREVEGTPGYIENETQLVHALRGRLDASTVKVMRAGAEVRLNGRKRPVPSVLEQRGVFFSGVMFGALVLRDAHEINVRGLMVHHIEPGSFAEAQALQRGDVLERVDGVEVIDLDTLNATLAEAQHARRRVTLSIKRLGESTVHSVTLSDRFRFEVFDW